MGVGTEGRLPPCQRDRNLVRSVRIHAGHLLDPCSIVHRDQTHALSAIVLRRIRTTT